jgi:serine/threonine protein kinase
VTACCFVFTGGLPLQQLLRYGGQILSALVELHNQGVVMADLKPQNLLLDDDLDELVVTDFGLSRIVSHTGGWSML